jgi:hypothetical protein
VRAPAVPAPVTRRERAAAFTLATLTAADRREASAVVLGYLLGAYEGLDGVATAEYVNGVRDGLRAAAESAAGRRAALLALGSGPCHGGHL